MLTINNNMSSMIANQLFKSQNSNMTSLQRLSTGLRINSAKDDAAGLYVSKGIETTIRGLDIANRNTYEGISMLQVAEGALDTVQTGLMRLNDLALLASSDTIDDGARAAYQKEATSIAEGIKTIAESTTYGSHKLLDASTTAMDLQVGTKSTSQMDSGIVATGLSSVTSLADILAGTFDISDATKAQALVGTVEESVNGVSTMRAGMGATMISLEGIIDRNTESSINLSTARSRIVETDYAKEMANLANTQLRQQVGLAMLGQANSSASMVLSLL